MYPFFFHYITRIHIPTLLFFDNINYFLYLFKTGSERPLHTLEQKIQFYTGPPCYYRDYQEYYQRGSMEYNSYRYQDAILCYDFAINIINNTNYKEYHDEAKHDIIKSLGNNIYVDKGNALCIQHKYVEGTIQYEHALSTYNKLTKQDHIIYLIVLAQHNFGSAMLELAIGAHQQGDKVRAQEYYKKTLELYKPGEKYGLCNINELGKEVLNSLDHHKIKNKYISIYDYSNTDILHTNILGEVELCY
jgi:tetratricopeptide (TPR) repeat protein